MTNLETVRAFVAVPPSSELIQALADVQRRLKHVTNDRCVRWVDPHAIHLTLFFLGDVLTTTVRPLREALGVVARNVPPFHIQARGLGAFPNVNRPRVVWVGVEDPTAWLALLHEAVSEALESLGFERERRRFSPHLTLGRVRRGVDRGEVQRLGEAIRQTELDALVTVAVEDLVLFRSDLKPTGAEYTRLATFSLGTAA